MAVPLLEVRQLSVVFGGLVALDAVDLMVEDGETLAILGPNGAGKTTLFNAVAGVVSATRGRVLLRGEDITGEKPSRRCGRGIVRTFQITQPFVGLSVRENIMVALTARGASMRAARAQAGEYADFVGLSAKLDEGARTLSTGQRKRLELARALAAEPRLLLLDEVTGGVDRPSVPGLLELIARLRTERQVTIIIVEHSMEVIAALAGRAVFLNRGSIVVEGDVETVMNDPTVRDIYLGDALAEA